MKTSEKIIEKMKTLAPKAIKLPDKYDRCIVGIVDTPEGFVFLYSESELLILLQMEMKTGYAKALKYLEFEIIKNAITPNSPAFLFDKA